MLYDISHFDVVDELASMLVEGKEIKDGFGVYYVSVIGRGADGQPREYANAVTMDENGLSGEYFKLAVIDVLQGYCEHRGNCIEDPELDTRSSGITENGVEDVLGEYWEGAGRYVPTIYGDPIMRVEQYCETIEDAISLVFQMLDPNAMIFETEGNGDIVLDPDWLGIRRVE